MRPDLVVLGNLLLDDVVLPDGRTRMAEAGGASLYLALAAAAAGVRTGVCAPVGDDYPALARLERAGVDLTGLRRTGAPSLRTWLLYEGRRRRVVHRLDGPTHADVSPRPTDVPNDWRAARAWHLAPLPLEIQHALLGAARAARVGLVSLDPYVLLDADGLRALAPLLSDVDVLFLSEDEMLLEIPEEDPLRHLRPLCQRRLRTLVFKRGARGGVAWDAVAQRAVSWTPSAGDVVDTTGAGDALAAGVLAGLLDGAPLESALRRGADLAARAISAWGTAGLER